MNKQEIEKKFAVLLFALVLIIFSLAERDSKKLERLYTTAQLLKKSPSLLTEVATQPPVAQTPGQ
ncbi:MAG TPA: hypothetical protein VEY10_00615 [Flavisolibacter sp.]|jgi:hypothetical protein|nr:hypothetical protein [Flavisolibacter sp.]